MNDSTKWGIKHLSPSSLNLWAANQGLWYLKYIEKFKEEMPARVWLGLSVEDGLTHFLYKRDRAVALETALITFENNAQGDLSDDVQIERERVEPALNQAITAMYDRPVPVAKQFKYELWLDGVDIPVIGYADYVFNDEVVDLKTTMQCPSKPKPDHSRQVAFYSEASKKAGALLYVTPKKHAAYPVETAQSIAELTNIARSLCDALKAGDKAAMRERIPLTFDDFRWTDETANAALEAWAA